jgi:hypothetical protein
VQCQQQQMLVLPCLWGSAQQLPAAEQCLLGSQGPLMAAYLGSLLLLLLLLLPKTP